MSDQKKQRGSSRSSGKPCFTPFRANETLSEYTLITFPNEQTFMFGVLDLRRDGERDGIAASELLLANAKRNEETGEICILLFALPFSAPSGLAEYGIKVEKVYRTPREIIEWTGAGA